MLNAPAGAPPENNERDVDLLYGQFLAEINQPLQLALKGLEQRAKRAESIDTHLPVLGGLVHHLASRVAHYSGAAKVLDDSLLAVHAGTVTFLQTLSDAEVLRLADRRQFPVHYDVREVNGQRVDTARVYITDIPHPEAQSVPADNYLHAVQVVYQYPFPFPREISGIDTNDRMIRPFPAANKYHTELNDYIVTCRAKLQSYAQKVAYTANQLMATADPERQQKLAIVVTEAEIVSGMCRKDDVIAFQYQEILVRSMGYATPDMQHFQDQIDRVDRDLYKRIVVRANWAGIDYDDIAQHTSTGQTGATMYRRTPDDRD